MVKQFAVIALGVAMAASNAQAQQVLLKDTFDTENGGAGASQLNYASFANWNVTGKVDLVKSGSYSITCSGSCVDLDGSSGPGALASKLTYSFAAGDVMRFSARIGGAQRGQTARDSWSIRMQLDQPTDVDDVSLNFGSGFASGGSPINGLSSIAISGSLLGSDGFRWVGIQWRALEAGAVRLDISTESNDAYGPILDEVLLERTAVPEPGSFALIGTGLLALGAAARRRRA